MFCFENTSAEKSCFVVDLVYFILLCLQVAVSLMLREGKELSHRLPGKLREKVETKERSSRLPGN